MKAKKNLSGLSFAIEGTLEIVTEEYITRLIAYNGGECKKNITASIKYVIIGEDPDSSMLRKVKYAKGHTIYEMFVGVTPPAF